MSERLLIRRIDFMRENLVKMSQDHPWGVDLRTAAFAAADALEVVHAELMKQVALCLKTEARTND